MSEESREEWTSIKVIKTTRDRLKKQRITRRETYDEIINRILDDVEIAEKKSE